MRKYDTAALTMVNVVQGIWLVLLPCFLDYFPLINWLIIFQAVILLLNIWLSICVSEHEKGVFWLIHIAMPLGVGFLLAWAIVFVYL